MQNWTSALLDGSVEHLARRRHLYLLCFAYAALAFYVQALSGQMGALSMLLVMLAALSAAMAVYLRGLNENISGPRFAGSP